MMKKFTLFTSVFFLFAIFMSNSTFAQLSGTYTIGSTGTYSNFSAAISALYSQGVSGAVTFNVQAGTYNDHANLNGAITGASATNTITFDGASLDSVTLQYSGSSYATVRFYSADYVTFTNMTIKHTSTSYATAVHFRNNADHNTVSNCHLEVPISSSSNFKVIMFSNHDYRYNYGSNYHGSYNKILNNTIKGGYLGISIYGSTANSTSYNHHNEIIGNEFTNQYYYGIRFYYGVTSTLIQHNHIHNMGSTTAYAIYSYYGKGTTIDGNIINPGRYGAYLYRENYYGSLSTYITNNIICDFNYTSYQTGLYIYYYCYRINILHNNIEVKGSSSSYQNTCIYAYYYPRYSVIKNNILSAPNYYGYCLSLYYYPYYVTIDYNNYNYPASHYYKFYGHTSNYMDLNAWKNFSNYIYTPHDQNSVSQNPNFLSSTDLHVGSAPPQVPIVLPASLMHDVDNEARPTTGTHYIGADKPQDMSFESVECVQLDTSDIFSSQQKCKIINAKINVDGAINALPLGNIYFTTTGTNSNDIKRIKVYSQNTTPLDENNLLTTVENPGSSFILTPPTGSTVADARNIILAVDLSHNSQIGNYIDFSFDSIKVDDTMRYPPTANPVGSREIVHPSNYKGYCDVTRQNSGNYAVGIKRVRFETIDNSTITLAGGLAPNNTAVQVYASPIPTIYKQLTYPITINHGELNTQNVSVYIDWDNDGIFATSEREFTTGSLPEASTTNKNITVPCIATPGYHRMRISSDLGNYTPPACGVTRYGEVEDYFIYVAPEDTPVVSFTNADTGYVGGMTKFYPVSNINGNIEYLWDYDSDNVIDDTAKVGGYVFTTAGSKTVTLKAVLYGCEDTIISNPYTATIPVVTPYSTPEVNFISNFNTVTTAIPVNFTDLTTLGPSTWKWKIEPKIVNNKQAYTFNISDSEQNPTVNFTELGEYTVTLVVTNTLGADSNVKIKYITVVKEQIICDDVSSDLRTGYLYDDGGKDANYTSPSSAGNTCGYVISPKCASSVTLDFLDFDVCSYQISSCPNLPSDAVKIYDGVDNTGTALHLQFLDMLGNPIYPNGFTNGASNVNIGIPPSVTATSGSMYVEFYTNCLAVGPGFEAKWSTQVFTPTPPQASIGGNDTIFTNQSAYFYSTSSGYLLDYAWDFTGDGYGNSFDSSDNYQYTTAGTYNIRLVVYSCDYTDTSFKTLVVIEPTAKPVADFEADYVRVTDADLVTITDKSVEGVYDWVWTITPATFTYENGTGPLSKEIQLKFTDTGYYDVKLFATNSIGSDSLTKSSYIYVYDNCLPSVANLNSDIGISNVILVNANGDTLINNQSSIGKRGYTNYAAENITASLYKTGEYTITLKRNSNFNKITRTIYFDFNQDGDFYDAQEKLANQSNSPDMDWTTTFTIPANVLSGITKMRIATNAGQLVNSGCGPNFSGEFEDYGIYINDDNNKPVITLIGADTFLLNSCGTFIDPGYVAWDAESGDLSNSVVVTGTVNSTVQGYYPFTYNVADNAGNNAEEVIRIVEVLPDIVDPTITIYGKNPDSVAVFATYTDLGFKATDNCSGVKSSNTTGSINPNIVGWDTLFYTATDNANNVFTYERYVYVYDDIDPTISLKGSNPITIDVLTSFNDPGVDLDDNYYSNLSYVTSGYVDTSKIGSYFLTYCVTDESGNGPICVDRTVIVEDNEAPQISLKGDSIIYVEVFNNFIDPGVTIKDNYWSERNMILTTTGNVNTYVLGEYTISYIVTDASGNASTILTRTVKVVDETPPTIALKGETTVTIYKWSDYEDAGVTVMDNYYNSAQLTVDTNANGTFNGTASNGLFSYTFSVCDPSGNCSQDISRIIFISTDTSNSISEKITEDNMSYYPNPANDKLFIELNLPSHKDVDISIINTLGEQVMIVHQGMVQDRKFKVNVANISSGLYYIRVNVKNSLQFNKKFIIAR